MAGFDTDEDLRNEEYYFIMNSVDRAGETITLGGTDYVIDAEGFLPIVKKSITLMNRDIPVQFRNPDYIVEITANLTFNNKSAPTRSIQMCFGEIQLDNTTIVKSMTSIVDIKVGTNVEWGNCSLSFKARNFENIKIVAGDTSTDIKGGVAWSVIVTIKRVDCYKIELPVPTGGADAY